MDQVEEGRKFNYLEMTVSAGDEVKVEMKQMLSGERRLTEGLRSERTFIGVKFGMMLGIVCPSLLEIMSYGTRTNSKG